MTGMTTACRREWRNSLVDPLNPAGYPQPLRENFYHNGGGDQEIAHRSYYGLERLL